LIVPQLSRVPVPDIIILSLFADSRNPTLASDIMGPIHYIIILLLKIKRYVPEPSTTTKVGASLFSWSVFRFLLSPTGMCKT
jgi:hypothetical protein